MVMGKLGVGGIYGFVFGGGAFMHLAEGGVSSAGVFLVQSREVLGCGGEKW